jgi:hypothetical protein
MDAELLHRFAILAHRVRFGDLFKVRSRARPQPCGRAAP